MSQRAHHSLIEIVSSTAFGFVVSIILSQMYYHEQSFMRNIGFTCVMTVVSIARGYVWRRGFNWLERNEWNIRKTLESLAGKR